MPSSPACRRRIELRGRVQGVGLRPYVSNLATQAGLAGQVENDPRGVVIEIEGPSHALDDFQQRLESELPRLASITSLELSELTPLGLGSGFMIKSSTQAGDQATEISPDVAPCDDCLIELADPSDRRHGYPFINCTSCGPRYSIQRSVPYDRERTSMAAFELCTRCQSEYDSPESRRYHAQANACPDCGPRLWLVDRQGVELDGDPLARASELIRDGRIVAIKGVGGFHLACRADSDRAVLELRRRKDREAKPFAVMVGSVDEAKSLVELDAPAVALLGSWQRPIVIAPQRSGGSHRLSRHVAPGCATWGVMLPTTPLHELLLQTLPTPLVMTSGNRSAEPLCSDNRDALDRLGQIADALLLNDREIVRPLDDSVFVAVPEPLPLRRARGFVPESIQVSCEAPQPVLALGGDLKGAIALMSGRSVVLGEHLGDLSNPAALRGFVRSVEQLPELLGLEPKVVACDLHPSYASSRFARGLPLPSVQVQHHHAHVLSCAADNGLSGRVIGIAADGTGYGADGGIWGCEILCADELGFERLGHLRGFPLVGGERAALETWRPAAGLLSEAYGGSWPTEAGELFARVEPDALAVASRQLTLSDNLLTTSLGRLFDGVAFLLGLADTNRHEAEAAMALEALAAECRQAEPLPFELSASGDSLKIDHRPLVQAIVDGRLRAVDPALLARAFHEAVARALAELTLKLISRTGLERVVLSGGCFANRLLVERLTEQLRAGGASVFQHRQVPTGDGGLALGQAVVATARWSRRRLDSNKEQV